MENNRYKNRFGYDEKVPENIRLEVMWLCQDVTALQNKWDFYLGLFGEKENTDLLSDLASWSFTLIEESLRYDMTMAICRLRDPAKDRQGNKNLSLGYLVENCRDVDGLDSLFANFRSASAPVNEHRNKRVGHSDLNTRIKPREHPLPGVNKDQIELILMLVSNILKTVFQHYTGRDLDFHTVTIDDAETLIFLLKGGKEFYSRGA
jgi:hypothetical protein